MGITPPMSKFADVGLELLGIAMTSYYGGRSEVKVRRLPLPVVYVDFLSMYPTVNTLLGLWRSLIATGLEVVDATGEIQHLGMTLTLQRCFEPGLWEGLSFFASIVSEIRMILEARGIVFADNPAG